MIRITINGMSCQNCVRHVTEALTALDGVTDVKVSLEKGEAEVEAAEDPSDAQLKQVLKEEGYDVTGIVRL